MSDQNRDGIALAAGTALGLGIAAFLGMLAYVLFLRRQQQFPTKMLNAAYAPTLPAAPAGMLPAALPAPQLGYAPFASRATVAARGISQDSLVRTYTLPAVTSSTEAFRLATSPTGGGGSRVTVRVIAPQGALAVLAFTSNELNVGNALAESTLVIPTGQHQTIRIAPGQALYGKGQIPNVMVSVVQAEE